MYHIGFSSSNQYVPYVAVAITSIVKTAGSPDEYADESNMFGDFGFAFHILSDEISQENNEKLRRLEAELGKIVPVSIAVHIVDNAVFVECPMWKGSYVTYYKTVVDRFLPQNAKRVLFMDADALAVADIRELMHTDMHGKCAAGVAEKKNYTLPARKGNGSFCFTGVKTYFNAGVVLIDLQKWREKQCEAKVIEFLKTYSVINAEQDALNAVLDNDVHLLPFKWNMKWAKSLHPDQADVTAYNFKAISPEQEKWYWEGLKNPAIVHYSVRPWDGDGFFVSRSEKKCYFYPFIDKWWYFAEITPVFAPQLLAVKEHFSYKRKALQNKLVQRLLQYAFIVRLLKLNDSFKKLTRKIEKPLKKIRNAYKLRRQKALLKAKQK